MWVEELPFWVAFDAHEGVRQHRHCLAARHVNASIPKAEQSTVNSPDSAYERGPFPR
jgi:hypothetical protein